MGKNVADIKLTANSGIELPLPNPKDVKKVLILGNTIGFFGYPGEGCNISNIHGEDAKRFAWMYNCALLGVEFEILGEEEEFDYYSDLFQKIKERYGYEAEATFVEMKKNEDYDTALETYIDEMEDTGKKRFDFAIMNPPYDRNLHLKFLEKVIKVADKVVNISPIAWLQFPTREKPEFLNGHILGIEIVDRIHSNYAFGIDTQDLGIYHLTSDTSGKKISDYCCFAMNTKFCDNWKNVQSIWNKILSKQPYILSKVWSKNPQSAYTVRLYPVRERIQGNMHDPNKTALWKLVSMNEATNALQTPAQCVRYLSFDSKEEQYNAWQSYLTDFARFCIAMDESVKPAPYMGDYTKPWTNARFCEYFGITGFISDTEAEPDSEWETILETMKKYA